MSSSRSASAALSTTQALALSQLQAILNNHDDERDIDLLRNNNWDVQRTISSIYDDEPAVALEPGRQDMELEEGPVERAGAGRAGAGGVAAVGLRLAGLLRWPLELAWGIVGGVVWLVAKLLRLPVTLPTLSTLFRRIFYPSPAPSDPRIASERFVRSLEESTGLLSRPFHSASSTSTSGAAASTASEPGLSTARLRKAPEGSERVLPDFWVGSYRDAMREVRDRSRLGMVLLLSGEHEADEVFRREVVGDQELVRVLAEADVLVWGGDVREREAWQVANLLDATTYPFIAFVSLQPLRSRTPGPAPTSSTPPRLAVLSRLEGSPSTTTSAASMIAHLQTVLLPRVGPYLQRLRSEKAAREAAVRAREERERREEEVGRADAERVMKARREAKEREEREAREREEARRREAEREERERSKAERDALAQRWRAWAASALVPPEPGKGDQAIRLAFKLPDGRRLVRSFAPSTSLEHVYAYVETAFASSSAFIPAPDTQLDKPAGYDHTYAFRLASAFPRVVLQAGREAGTLGEVKGLERGGNVLVEWAEGEWHGREESEDEDEEVEDE